MLYARKGGLDAWKEAVKGPDWDAAFRVRTRLDTSDMDEIEPFGFADGLSQPRLDWQRALDPEDKEQVEYVNVVAPGEIVLGYRNEYGRYTERPLIDPSQDPRALDLPPAEDVPNRRDLGRNGSYLVFRQLHQDVRGFWQFLDRQANAVPEERWRLAEAMVGRTRKGTPLVPLSHDPIAGVGPAREDIAFNHFTYASDPDGLRCPLGAHVRRANPRTGDLPAGTRGLIARLLRMLGFKSSSFRDDLVAPTRFHRLLRRGREYGKELTPEDALGPGPGDEERGLHFICLVANLSRQFEFVQNAWIASTKFAGLSEESDPLLGTRAPPPTFADARTRDRHSLALPRTTTRALEAAPRFREAPPAASFRSPGRARRRAASRACRSSSRSRAAPISSCRGSGRCATSRARPRPRRSQHQSRRLRASDAGRRRCGPCIGRWSAACISSAASSRSSARPSTAPCASRWPA